MFKLGVHVLPICLALGALDSGVPERSSVIEITAPSVTGTPRPPPCKPTFVLDGVAEDGFNKPDTPFTIRPSCNSLSTKSHAVFVATGPDADQSFGLGALLEDTQVTPDGITVSGLDPGYKAIIVTATDDQGDSLFGSFALLFGSITMPLKVVDEEGEPVLDTNLTAEAFAGIEQHSVTGSSGVAAMANLPPLLVELSASTAGKRIGSMVTIATSSTATLRLPPSSLPVGCSNIVERGPYPGIGSSDQLRDSRSRCDASPGSAICQLSCQNPRLKSCDFYTRCAEETLRCGRNGYPLRYGAKNCRRFVARLDSFSPQGQAWIWKTMLCLQKYLVKPVAASDATCDSVNHEAFQSHPRCYVDSGFCDLPLNDLVQVVVTVKSDLFQGPAIEQALTTAKGCARRYASKIKERVVELRGATGGANAATRFNTIAIFEDVQAYLEKLSPGLA